MAIRYPPPARWHRTNLRGVDLDEARSFALGLPETTEEPHFDMSSFRVRGRIFATVPPDGGRLHVFVDVDEIRASVAEDPAAFEELRWGKKLSGVRVTLAGVAPERVRELLEDSWRRRAPKRVVAAYDAHRAASEP
jgi:hypothetical protein